ncbi:MULTISPECIES: ABC transporter permease [unclassified Oceanobacter]|jgi:peptide/nickel transport system permease protein|uniref:ABC transporter permease n=1 Tax=unclassified Oceanobacter TaxID=2620260 RepID=UPI0026E17822|nr:MULTISPECIES: ABC transporter permease [unclassified Oceanobacter]MDO6683575.1 ABC transporter permease [Oceanobacter sp. 5_MG-2023]MDP2504810.1 ABC transporter permease [Oceanobacter sp. 3_MG-2023]MDP2546253.1 ABC transporter permease [Oceanobacter sp. 4_MG-2023]MDP2607555.1 ABC transporter permease [Oceanobacter sp. 1_MG-2023]MDP2610823.1 ABC transporter permease [Oceanobacter sp. 2_MG-2023]
MLAYIIRRLLYAVPILVGVNVLTFALFFVVNSPDQMALVQLGDKHIDPQAVEQWKVQRGYDKPLFINDRDDSQGLLTDTIFFDKSMRLFVLDFGKSDEGRAIGDDIQQRMWPSLAVALPTFIVGLTVNIAFALFVVMFRASLFDTAAMVACVVLMSISGVFYVFAGQYFFAKTWNLVPISGYLAGIDAVRFLILPVIIGVISGIGGGTRLYRTLFLEEANKDYVRTARAKGVPELTVLFRHILPNGLIPILTSVVVVIPSLFMGSLLTESFFGIPGLGSYTLDAIQAQDFAIVRSMVFLGSVLYIIGLILTDISYTLVDPRVRLS